MNDATPANNYAYCPQTRLEDERLLNQAGIRGAHLHVGEDRAPYRPDSPSAEDFDSSALGDAEDLLDEALNLVGLMLAAVGEKGDGLAMQTEAGLKAAEERLRKARIRIDEHDTCHRSLLLAYRDLQDATEREM